jgi:hypothetical protein
LAGLTIDLNLVEQEQAILEVVIHPLRIVKEREGAGDDD